MHVYGIRQRRDVHRDGKINLLLVYKHRSVIRSANGKWSKLFSSPGAREASENVDADLARLVQENLMTARPVSPIDSLTRFTLGGFPMAAHRLAGEPLFTETCTSWRRDHRPIVRTCGKSWFMKSGSVGQTHISAVVSLAERKAIVSQILVASAARETSETVISLYSIYIKLLPLGNIRTVACMNLPKTLYRKSYFTGNIFIFI